MLFSQRRNVSGGFLLAWAIFMKLFPAFLGLYLLFRRQYRAVAATVVWSAFIVLVSLPIVGLLPYRAFFQDQLARIIGGGAWDKFLGGDLFASGQYTVYGILLSLRPWAEILSAAAPYALMSYTAFVVGVIWVSARRAGSLLAGLAITNLAAMAGYYAPPEYTAVGVTALVLMAAGWRDSGLSRVLVTLLLWGFFSAAAWPDSFPAVWRYPSVVQFVYILGFVAAVIVNAHIATRPPARAA
jgi:hypothetical protein